MRQLNGVFSDVTADRFDVEPRGRCAPARAGSGNNFLPAQGAEQFVCIDIYPLIGEVPRLSVGGRDSTDRAVLGRVLFRACRSITPGAI